MKEQNSEIFFVEVKNPTEIRKCILETLKDILEVLHRFESFKRVRSKKLENLHKLRALLKDANKMLGNLKLNLPQTNLKAVAAKIPLKKQEKAQPASKKSVSAPQAKPQKREMTELDKLNAELDAIESKLKSLT